MKKDARLNMRLEVPLFEAVRAIARDRGVTVTHLIDQHFRELVASERKPKTDEELGISQA